MNSTLTTICSIAMLFTTPLISAKTVEFTIDGIKSNKGKIYVQLFKGEANYQGNKAYLSSIAVAKQGQITIRFNDLGVDDLATDDLATDDADANDLNNDYAIRYYHDENDNASMETNLFGMPTEGYGYSNNAKANYGPVKYAEIKFNLATENVLNTSTIAY